MAMCVMAVVGAAPCQCFSPGANHTTSPGRIFLHLPAVALHPAASAGDDQGLPERVGVPSGACSRLEGHARATDPCRVRPVKQRVNTHRAGEPVCRSLGGRLSTASCNLHSFLLYLQANEK